MASYTDNIPKFNPYVQTVPVDEMVKVGMYKQQKYEEGIQKIQTSIDNIAGLDVASELDKTYLQSKLNQLGNDLTTVAAGDFSNFQLVNSTTGMVSQIARDPNVQNAVSSTARLRKQQAEMEKAISDGKSSPQNIAKFQEGVSKYLNKEDLKQSYTGRYTQYIDIEKKLREVADKIHEVDNTIEDPFKRDGAGNHILDAQGRPIIDDAILKVTTKGKPAEKILANFYDSLDENDLEQLRTDAWYHYRGATADTFKRDAVKNYEETKKMLNDKIIQKSVELSTSPNLTTAEKNKIAAEITDANKKLTDGSLDKELVEQVDGIYANKNIEDYKYKLYTQKTLTNLAKDMSWQSYEQEYKTNPYAQMDMQKKDLQFKYDNAAREQRNTDREFGWKQYTWTTEQAQKAEEAKTKNQGSLPPVTNQAISTDIDTPDAAKLDKEILAITGEKTKDGRVIKAGQIDLLTNSYLDKVTNSELKTPQQKATYLNYLSREYAKNPDKLVKALGNPNLAQYLDKRRALEITAAQKQALYVSTKAESSKIYDTQIKKLLKADTKNTVKYGNTVYGAEDMLPMINVYRSAITVESTPVKSNRAPKSYLDAQKLLSNAVTPKQKYIANALIKYFNNQPLNSLEQSLVNATKNVDKQYSPVTSKIYAEKRKFETDYLAARMPERQVQVGTLDYEGNAADQSFTKKLIGNKINEFTKLGQVDVKKWGEFDPEKLNKIRESKNVSYTIEKKYDGSANLIVTDGVDKQTVPMTAGEFSRFYPRLAQSNPWNDIKSEVLASPSHTTNISGTGDDSSLAVNAKLSGQTAPRLANTSLAPLVRFDVEGAADNDGGDNDSFILKMYVNNNNLWKSGYVGSRFTSLASIQEQVKNIGPGTVSDFLKINK